MRTTAIAHAKRDAGFTMLEVLISIVVIAFGLLGIAGLQAFALKNNQSAGQRMTTTMLANDMIERVLSSSTNFRFTYSQPDITQYGQPDPTSPCLQGGCSPAQLVAFDLAEWQDRVARSLPSGQGIICQDNTPDDGINAASPACDGVANAPLVVKIWWLDDRSVTATAATPLQRLSWSFNP